MAEHNEDYESWKKKFTGRCIEYRNVMEKEGAAIEEKLEQLTRQLTASSDPLEQVELVQALEEADYVRRDFCLATSKIALLLVKAIVMESEDRRYCALYSRSMSNIAEHLGEYAREFEITDDDEDNAARYEKAVRNIIINYFEKMLEESAD